MCLKSNIQSIEILEQKAQALIIEASGVPKACETLTKKGRVSKRSNSPLFKKTFLIPHLIGNQGQRSLRIKTINKEERYRLMSSNSYEFIAMGSNEYVFGFEPKSLEDPHSFGTLVSRWSEDKKVTKLRLLYRFAEVCLGVLGHGFGSRPSVPSLGSNSYFKKYGRGTDATTSSPAQEDTERSEQQYYRETEHKNQLMHPMVRKLVNELSNNILEAGREANPYLMKMVGRVCDRQILTMGFVPHPRGPMKVKNVIQAGSSNPTFGFVNSAHVDSCDKLEKDQIEDWQELAKHNRWKLCERYLAMEDFCLPTNCGYQFVYNGEHTSQSVRMEAYFAMEGLGAAVQLQDGIFHHFMGAMFSHQTCMPLCKRVSDGYITGSNQDNIMQIVGWGSCGGSREVAEAKARARAVRVVAARRSAARAASRTGEAA